MRHHKLTAHQADGRRRRRARRPDLDALEQRNLLATITVTGAGDTIAKDGVVTLREAITAANTNADPSGDTTPGNPGSDTIAFNVPGTGVRTVHLTSTLPTITEPVVIDGYTQPGSSANTLADGDNAVLLIELNRGDLASNGLTITAGNSTIRGLVINGNISSATYAIEVSTAGGNRIEGSFLGSDPTGNADVGTKGLGVHILGAADNTIGGTTPAARNLIWGGSGFDSPLAVQIEGSGATRNLVQGNFIGTNAAGTACIVGGSVLLDNAPGNTIGGTTPGARNVITGYNPFGAAVVIQKPGATGNLVQGNFIGIDVTGTTSIAAGFFESGLAIQDASGNTIGGTTPGARNIISGNGESGVVIGAANGTASDNLVQGNFIGTDATGIVAVPNAGIGVVLEGIGALGPATGNTIGGTTPGAGNIISGNAGDGISLRLNKVPGRNVIQGNSIGVNASGAPLGNMGHGVSLSMFSGRHDDTIGGTTSTAGNIIAFNGKSGVIVYGAEGVPTNTGNAILSNSIYANGRLGIDLTIGTDGQTVDGDGPTGNDPGDFDEGPNNKQNFPIIISVTTNGQTTVSGTLNSTPDTTFTIQFFSSAAADPSSFGEGETFLTQTSVTTDANGDASFTVPMGVAVAGDRFITATATGPDGTSEFSPLVADLAVTATASADPAPAGADLTYTITVTNTGISSPSGPVTVTDTLPAHITFISATGGVTPVQGVLKLDLGIIPIGGSTTATIIVRPDAAAAGTTITNTAKVISTVNDPDAADNAVTTLTTIGAASASQADLSVTVTDSADEVNAGDDITYTITVVNDGPDPAANVALTDAIPAHTTFVSFTAPAGFAVTAPPAGGTGTVTATAASLASGASAVLTLVVRVVPGTTSGTAISDTATVATTTTDPSSTDHSATTTAAVNAPTAVADLAVAIAADPDPAAVGQELTYTVTVTNHGPDPATGVTLTDTLDPGATFVSATGGATPVGGVLTFGLGTLADGGTATVTIVVRATGAAGQAFTNTASVAGAVTDSQTNNDTAVHSMNLQVPDAVDLSVVLTKGPAPVAVGADLTYTITVHNGGAIAATGVKLTDRLPAGVTFVSATGGATPSNGVLNFDLGTLNSGANVTVSVVVVPDTVGRLTNTAEARANEADAVATDNADSLDTEVSRIATTTTVTPSATTVIRGGVVTFVVSVAHPAAAAAGPAGTVTLHDGAVDLGSAPLDAGGTATFAVHDLAIGSHAIAASYSGDPRYEPSSAAVTVHIEPAPPGAAPAIPGGPIAVPDEYRVLARTRLTVSTPDVVLRNDLGIEGRPTQVRLVQGPRHGRLVFRADGTFRYVPRASFHGMDSFTYVASDRGGDSAPTVVRIQVDALRLERRTVVVPGDPSDLVSVRFTWTVRDAGFNNELGVIRVDDADGSIGGIRPGDPRYLRAAAAAGRMRVVFHSGESAGVSREISLRGSERFLAYFVQDRSTAKVLERNAEDRPGRSPRVFFADLAANPDRFDHVRAGERDGRLSLAWEDLLGGGDHDFNDMVLTIRAIRLGR